MGILASRSSSGSHQRPDGWVGGDIQRDAHRTTVDSGHALPRVATSTSSSSVWPRLRPVWPASCVLQTPFHARGGGVRGPRYRQNDRPWATTAVAGNEPAAQRWSTGPGRPADPAGRAGGRRAETRRVRLVCSMVSECRAGEPTRRGWLQKRGEEQGRQTTREEMVGGQERGWANVCVHVGGQRRREMCRRRMYVLYMNMYAYVRARELHARHVR